LQSHHGRDSSDANPHGSRRHDDFIKDQKRQAAEHAITDKYASAMISSGAQNHRNYLTSSNEAADSANIVGGISNMAAMS